MKILHVLALVVAAIVGGCGGKPVTTPTDFGQPYDRPPASCSTRPPTAPVVPDKDLTGPEAQAEYTRLQNAYRSLEHRHRTCQAWARRQR